MTEKFSKVKQAELAADVRAFDKLEPVIHSKARLAIVSVLAANESLSFVEVRDGLHLTDGNLAAHLRALEQARIVTLRKVGHDTKPVTVISLTATGRTAFSRYLEGLEHIINRHR
jgi:DNA-binding MarR family transcriptional regulator